MAPDGEQGDVVVGVVGQQAFEQLVADLTMARALIRPAPSRGDLRPDDRRGRIPALLVTA